MFAIIPILDDVVAVIDGRIQTAAFNAEQLIKDTPPLNACGQHAPRRFRRWLGAPRYATHDTGGMQLGTEGGIRLPSAPPFAVREGRPARTTDAFASR
jgi:hypothetical protein